MRIFAVRLAAPIAALAHAAAAAPAGPSLPATTVAPVTVAPRGEPPKIVGAFPAPGQVIAPGALVLRITFDQKMAEDDFAFAAASGGPMPNCLKKPRLLNDEKTFVLLCTTAPGMAYAMAFNPVPKAGFANIGGTHAAPATLAFSTNEEDGPRDVDAALKTASLTRADLPISTQP